MRETTLDRENQDEVTNAEKIDSDVNEERKNNKKKINLNDLLRRLNESKRVDRKNNLLIIFSATLVISIFTLSVFYFI